MAGYCTRGQYFHSPSARKKTSAHSYNILPYSTFTGAIIIIYNYHCVDIFFQFICDRCTYVRTCACMAFCITYNVIQHYKLQCFLVSVVYLPLTYNIQLLVVMQENGVVHHCRLCSLVTLSHLHVREIILWEDKALSSAISSLSIAFRKHATLEFEKVWIKVL